MSEFQRYNHVPDSKLPEHNKVFLAVGEKTVPFLEAAEFRLHNPWSLFFRSVLTQLRDEARFSGKDMREIGVGDARNFFCMGAELRESAGVDAHLPALMLAAENITHLEFPVDLYSGDAVAFVKQPGDPWNGTIIICLPQTPRQDTSENKLVGAFDPENAHLEAYAMWRESGLQLVAATLGELSKRARHDLQVLVLLSGRIPTPERVDMLYKTGWAIEHIFATNEANIAQQSEGVSVAYIQKYADVDENLFWEKTATGGFSPIDPIEAEKRRLTAHKSSAHSNPNVYHHLYTYLLRPNKKQYNGV